MKEKKGESVNFRPKFTNRERLDKATKLLGIGQTDVLDGLLEDCLDEWIKSTAQNKIKQMEKVLSHR